MYTVQCTSVHSNFYPYLLLSAGGTAAGSEAAAISPANGEGAEGVEGQGVLPHRPHLHLAILTLISLLLPLSLRPVLLALQLNVRRGTASGDC